MDLNEVVVNCEVSNTISQWATWSHEPVGKALLL